MASQRLECVGACWAHWHDMSLGLDMLGVGLVPK